MSSWITHLFRGGCMNSIQIHTSFRYHFMIISSSYSPHLYACLNRLSWERITNYGASNSQRILRILTFRCQIQFLKAIDIITESGHVKRNFGHVKRCFGYIKYVIRSVLRTFGHVKRWPRLTGGHVKRVPLYDKKYNDFYKKYNIFKSIRDFSCFLINRQ